MREAIIEKKKRAAKIIRLLKKHYPDARCTLDFKTPHELLVATILSAQCTDERVNKLTADLFRKYRRPEDYAEAELKELENDIRPAGFFRNKAKSIKGSAKALVNDHHGKMPQTLDELVKLPGVGRKTGSVILGAAFGMAEGVVVDTHVKRIANRLDFTRYQDPLKIERDLMKIIAPGDWIILAHLLIDHGRAICKARKPDCPDCFLTKNCPSAKKYL
jgi:endonuclease-3